MRKVPPSRDRGQRHAPEGDSPFEDTAPFGVVGQGFSQSMPDLGTMPFKHAKTRRRQVTRLVSATASPALSIELQQGINRIGRQRKGNEIVLASPKVSRFHAEIDVLPDQIVLRDLGSANGTTLNGLPVVGEHSLSAGDLISFSEEFALRLSVDITVQEPDTLRLGNVGGTPPPREVQPEAIPSSLVRRIESHSRALPQHAPPLELRVTSVDDPVEVPSSRTIAHQDDRSLTDDVPAIDPGIHACSQPGSQQEQQLSVLYQLSQRCLALTSFEELDGVLITVLERTVAFERGFVTYQLPGGDWKLVMSPRGLQWERQVVGQLVKQALAAPRQLLTDARVDKRLGYGQDCRLLTPLRAESYVVGAIYLQTTHLTQFDPNAPDFIALFADIAANAVLRCARLGAGG